MASLCRAYRGGRLLAPLVLALLLAGCSFAGSGPPHSHFASFKTPPPQGRTVTICSAYGCKTKTPFTFMPSDLGAIDAIMRHVRRADTASEERRAVAHAIGWIENRVGRATGTDTDRKSIDFLGSGDPTQQDCVDEATNTTSYLMVLADIGLLRHHRVVAPMSKGILIDGRYPHYFAVIEDPRTGEKWAVDSSMHKNGVRPIIEPAATWYGPG